MTLHLAFQGTWDDAIAEPCCQGPANVDYAGWLETAGGSPWKIGGRRCT